MGYWGNNIAQPHTVPVKVSGKEGSVLIRLVPAPRGTGLVGGAASKKVLEIAGIQDCYTQSTGATRTKGNFLFATYYALAKTYTYMTPNFWGQPYLKSDELIGEVQKKDEAEKKDEGDDEDFQDDEEDDFDN